jgi:GNAT superfamily N-acetyltransferase
MPLKTFTLAERPELEDEIERFHAAGWPRFLRQRDELGLGEFWPQLYTTFRDFQLFLCDGADRVVGLGHTVPLAWDGTAAGLPDSIAEILRNAVGARREGRRPNTLSALAAITEPARRGQGLSSEVLKSMAALARQHGLGALVAPVRPTLKASYPLAPMERYVRWTRPDGVPLDPWIRVHWRLGAEIVRIVPRTMVIAGTVAQWEDWTEMTFPDSGPYVVPGALQPLVIDRERDQGRYEDPNVWMHHPIT